MAVGDCERAFADAAAADGLDFERSVHPWLTRRGHLGLPPEAAPVVEALERVFVQLGGDLAELAARPLTPLRGDYVHRPSGTLVEVDEHQHFTTVRRATLAAYPPNTPLGFDRTEYDGLCAQWASRADRYFASKPAPVFGPGGRQRQRAYYDALRDLAAPALGYPPVVRAPAPDRDGRAAYDRVAARLRPLKASA